MSVQRRNLLGRSIAAAYTLSGLLVALALSWALLAMANFSYGLWHDHGGIGAAIDRYGPENKYRAGFHLTTKEQRQELFAGIVKAIHFDPALLSSLSYRVAGHEEQTLLTKPEVVHLQDVARLVRLGAWVALTALLVWVGSAAFFVARKQAFPAFGYQCLGILAGLVVTGCVVWMVGAVEVFYLLHTWVFPDGHAWFFYYQESLMSTMMYAPVLFGWIAAEWLILTLLVFVLLQYLLGRVGSALAKR